MDQQAILYALGGLPTNALTTILYHRHVFERLIPETAITERRLFLGKINNSDETNFDHRLPKGECFVIQAVELRADDAPWLTAALNIGTLVYEKWSARISRIDLKFERLIAPFVNMWVEIATDRDVSNVAVDVRLHGILYRNVQ